MIISEKQILLLIKHLESWVGKDYYDEDEDSARSLLNDIYAQQSEELKEITNPKYCQHSGVKLND